MSEYEPPAGSGVSLRFRVRYEDAPTGDKIGLDFRIGSYIPPFGDIIALDFKGNGYTPPIGSSIALDFKPESNVIGPNQYLFPVNITSPDLGKPATRLQFIELKIQQGINDSVVGLSSIRNAVSVSKPIGWQSSTIGSSTSIANHNQDVKPRSWASSSFSNQNIYNLTTYQKLNGIDSQVFGKPYLQGGVKYISPTGFMYSRFGVAYLVKYLEPSGINSLLMGAATVSPRMLSPKGIYDPSIGKPDIRTPVLFPLGNQYSLYGNPTVWFHTRKLDPAGVLSHISGYPKVADPTQFTQPPSLIESAIFGDTAIKNTSSRISVQSIYNGSFSDYSTLTNSNRYYQPKSIDSLAIGAASTVNKTPSVFVDSINPYDVGMPAIGHAIRSVSPTGFDHLLLGRTILTKTPELSPKGYDSIGYGVASVWYKNRIIDLAQNGIDSFVSGRATIWYGQRPISPNAWQSSNYGKPTLTHEVRELIAQGFVNDNHGRAWVSFGTRRLEPVAIYRDFASNHMVGGTQTIKPDGYEATLWGDRIIPESQSLLPSGFIGSFGDTVVGLFTRYILPKGYISVGTQGADRWGDPVVYNKLQYIVQEYDVNSGLSPPKWSDYLLISNRNITMNVTGFISQKFGYSQIDNNAAPVLPEAITPPPITIGMISHGIRSVTPESIEPPPLSTWGVIYNSGRVIAPIGHAHTQLGSDGTVINTRREYRNVGRIDSLETGTPTIGHRVRSIDIELRYSIAPPQINLPTIDLYTKYISFQGYETVKYGLPSLAIHLRLIAPKWNHQERQGTPTLRNVTPELGIYGHDSSEFGQASIRTQWRKIQAQGDTATLFGLHKIADTKQVIEVRGWQGGGLSQWHVVTKTGTPPYTTQNIWLQNESNPSENGFGIPTDSNFFTTQVSKPGLNQNVLYHKGHDSQKFGTAFLWSNNINTDGGIGVVADAVPSPTIINSNRTINVTGMDYTMVAGAPAISPHTIYAVMEAPPQAIENHEPRRLHYVNSSNGTRPPGEVFGKASIESTIRSIKPSWSVPSSHFTIGRPTITLSLQVVSPKSFYRARIGVPSIPFTDQHINMSDKGDVATLFGNSDIQYGAYLGVQNISPLGANVFSSGSNSVENYTRFVKAIGRDSLAMGSKLSNDQPFMWQGLRIGAHVPMNIGAGDTSLFGNTVIGLRVREVSVQGFVAFSSGYSLESFYGRMTVKNNDKKGIPPITVSPIGIDSESQGFTSNVKYVQQFIRPDGNSDQFRKGGYSG